jgi:hypothetical protein
VLVYSKYPKGSLILNGKRVHGFLEPYEATKVTWEEYKARKNDLVSAPYDKQILERMFPGTEFPDITFTYHQIRHLSWEQMCSLCKALGITTSRSNHARRLKLRRFFKKNC